MSELQPHRGTMILVLGILGLVICQPVGIAAWIMGRNDIGEMNAGRMDPEGRGLTEAGKILGIISVVILALSILVGVLMLGTVILSAAAAD